jgi:uncharacterized protein YjbI with pentapeptide repeats
MRTLRAVIAGLTAMAMINVVAAFTPEAVERLKSTGSCAGCDLFGENLAGLQAPKGDLSYANLGEASFYGGNLRGANLTGAVLDGANLKMVDLTGAIGVVFSSALTDERTKCPDGSAGPCQ